MDKPTIGIRQADGSFYEIMDDSQTGHKRLVLSAARTDQHGVKIDLYRSTDGTADPAGALGTIALDDPEGLGYQDIEFRVDLGAEGRLDASATLPGQPPKTLSVDLTPFRGAGADADILGDDFADVPEFALEPEPMTLDLPEVDDLGSFELPEDAAEPRRSDADILGDESLASADLDTLDDFGFDDGAEADSLTGPALDEDAFASEEPPLADSFDLGDLDAGFGEEQEPGADEPAESPAVNPAEDWEKISFDDMESMEFLDTGDEISKPSVKATPEPVSPKATKAPADDSFSLDHDDALDLGDYDSDLSDLPDLDTASMDASAGDDDFDQDFLPPPALTDTPSWDSEEDQTPSRPVKAPKAPKEARPAPPPREPMTSGGLDRAALVLSLATLSLLVLLILVLLFLNMIKSPQAPVVQPEVMRWKPVATGQVLVSPTQAEARADLASADPLVFQASSVLEVPAALRGAQVALRLPGGDTVADASRRFGDPARIQGNLLSW